MKMINYEEEHRKLWNWLADHPEMDKENYFEGWPEERIPVGRCFACEEAREDFVDSASVLDPCTLCPLGGPSVVGCFNPSGLYQLWRSACSPKKQTRYARKIAELPWKEVQHE